MKFVKSSFFVFALLAGQGLASYDASLVPAVAKSKEWLKRLHYRDGGIFSRTESQLDGAGFFFSPEGNRDPEKELLASLEALGKPLQLGRFKEHPQCAFPERFKFLKEAVKLSLPEVDCPRYRGYLEQFRAQSVAYVFSSAYPNNPGSMFGHSFFRFIAKEEPGKKKNDLLDYAISYAARVADDENGFAFIWLGTTGGYAGQFAMVPYYAKVNEYINSESRDLWEYELDLSPEQTEQLLGHLWEIETNSYFDYYFFDENCAYQLLAALEVARPDWDLLKFPIYVIPGESVKNITRVPGAVRAVKFRPSLRKQFFQRYDSLSDSERDDFRKYLENESQVPAPVLLDTINTYFQYLKQRQGAKLSDSDRNRWRLALVERSKAGSVPERPLVPLSETTRPDTAHHPFRVMAAGGVENFNASRNQAFQEISFKFAYHDLLNNDQGYPAFSQIDFPGIYLRYYNSQNALNLERVNLLNLTSLFPLTWVEKRLSWATHLEYLTLKDLNCDRCHVLHWEVGAGATFSFAKETGVLYLLAMPQVEMGKAFAHFFRFNPKLQLGVIWNPVPSYKIQLLANTIWDAFQNSRRSTYYELGVNQSLSLNQFWDVRVEGKTIFPRRITEIFPFELKTSLNLYF